MPSLQFELITGSVTGQNTSFGFTHLGGSIGRSSDCDWTLLDVDRYISNKHAVISYVNGYFLLTDTSSNGVFINGAQAALGKNNQHTLQASDSVTIGKHCLKVASIIIDDNVNDIALSINANDESDLLGLVIDEDVKVTHNLKQEPLAEIISNFQAPQSIDDDLGLQDILSGNSIPKSFAKESDDEGMGNFSARESITMDKATDLKIKSENPLDDQHYLSNDSSIPEDWELSGIMPAIQNYKVPSEEAPKKTTDPEPPIAPKIQSQEDNVVIPSPKEHESNNNASDETSTAFRQSPSTFDKTSIVSPEAPLEAEFLKKLYNKIGLPKEYISTLDADAFADDIATILLSSTKGFMSLLNSRSAFKQESRLSVTSVQPRSNNPIKFSIDPIDTLEMLLLKKKKGYLSAKESFDEAVEDIQFHQMAFLSGLQATLVGVLAQIKPETIEKQVNEKGRGFMGLNANSQYWQLYKDKQQLLSNTVNENLNEVLSTYFSDAYQAQINHFKNAK
ncbi:MAG: type VI secretion system-associated FHA domain protein TagH [Gammaproteobacteria bacterium]|nr:MAG: type VI secretion system-associated FHA domain protein TagH [Gammaproteobacteria bacterium]